MKLSQFTNDIILYVGHLKESTSKLPNKPGHARLQGQHTDVANISVQQQKMIQIGTQESSFNGI